MASKQKFLENSEKLTSYLGEIAFNLCCRSNMLGIQIQDYKEERIKATEAYVNYFLPDLELRTMQGLPSFLGPDLEDFHQLFYQAQAVKVPFLKRLFNRGPEFRLQIFASEFKDLRERLALFIENCEEGDHFLEVREYSCMINELGALKAHLEEKSEAFIAQWNQTHAIQDGVEDNPEGEVSDELAQELELAIANVLPIFRAIRGQTDIVTSAGGTVIITASDNDDDDLMILGTMGITTTPKTIMLEALNNSGDTVVAGEFEFGGGGKFSGSGSESSWGDTPQTHELEAEQNLGVNDDAISDNIIPPDSSDFSETDD